MIQQPNDSTQQNQNQINNNIIGSLDLLSQISENNTKNNIDGLTKKLNMLNTNNNS